MIFSRLFLVLGMTFSLSSGAFAGVDMSSEFFKATHVDIGADGTAYQRLLGQNEERLSLFSMNSLQHILDMGKRNLDYLKLVNANRTKTISLSNEATQQGFPIDAPKIYNPTMILQNYANLQRDMPKALADVVFGTGALPTTLAVSDEVYIEWGLKADRVYQSAARWLLMEPWLAQLKARRSEDLRGFYFMTRIPDVLVKLDNLAILPADEQANMKTWLVMLCGNTKATYPSCTNAMNQAVATGKAKEFYQRYLPAGQKLWDEMMFIPADGQFPDVQWNSDTDVRVPFARTSEPAVNDFLVKNLEEEWQRGADFILKVDFNSKSTSAIRITWEPGTTPHVPYLGASEIVMDGNAPLTEYDVQWTIRHEFGHNLGFPDCYVEFYDESIQAMMSYQIDITDLMCSRKGHLKDRHVEEMKKVYGQ